MNTVFIDTADGGRLEADSYPGGAHWVCLFHGKRFDKNVWREFAGVLQAQGHTVLVPNFRGYGASRPGTEGAGRFDLDAAAVLAFARDRCARLSALGASMAGAALLEGLCLTPHAIEHLILLSPAWEPAGGYACLREKAADALLWYGAHEPYRDACAAIGAQLPFPVTILVQDSELHAHAYFSDPRFAPRLTAAVLATLASGAAHASDNREDQ